MRITKAQKKKLADIVKSFDMSPTDFKVLSEDDFFKIDYKNSEFSYSIKKLHLNRYRNKYKSVENLNEKSFDNDWSRTINSFTNWVKNLSNDVKIETGWFDRKQENFLNTEYSYEQLNDLFSEDEKKIVNASINELKGKVSEIPIDQSSIIAFNRKLDSLNEKVDELNKFDWKSLFMGTITSLIMTLGIPPEASGYIYEAIKEAFSTLRLNK